MKGNPDVPGGPLTSKPTWSNTSGCSATSAFFRQEKGDDMIQEHELTHRQEREQEKEEHTPPTPGKYLTSRHLTWAVVVGVILIGAAVTVWTFLLPAVRGPG